MNYQSQNIEKLLHDLHHQPEAYWIKRGEQQALTLFHEMAQRVPAYADFLKKNHINYKKILTAEDFKTVPTIDKDNYLRAYKLKDLCWNGDLANQRWVFSTTSGSTGEPFYFPRQDKQDLQYALTAELYLRSNFHIDKKSTLYINGFAMGAWIGGLFTYQAIHHIASSGLYKLSSISPGIFKQEIIKAVKNLGNQFDQIIIGGYPPLIKDMIDEAVASGVKWQDYNVGFIFSAEGFSEEFRDYIIKQAHLKDAYTSTLNHYGTVDLGTMAHETPDSILVRRLVEQNQPAKEALFPEAYRLPTLAQYLPEMFYFEQQAEHNLIVSAWSGLPLVRYDLKDYGGVIGHQQMRQLLNEQGVVLDDQAKQLKIANLSWNLPYVYIYERRDFVVKLYGANVYPESIRKVLQKKILSNSLTGKCTLIIKTDAALNQYLEVNIELKKGRVVENTTLRENVTKAIVKQLLKENSEYRSNYKEIPLRQVPKVVFWPYEDPQHFMPGGKQKWVKHD